MRNPRGLLVTRWFVSTLALCALFVAPAAARAASPPEETFAPLAEVIEEAIHSGRCPGAVVLVGHQGEVIYRHAFGYRTLVPEKLPMMADTIFDMASLTKVMATTPAVMQLLEQGKIRLEDPVSKYWPEFKTNGKDAITVAELLTHYSGLRPDLDLKPPWSGYETAMKMIVEEKPVNPPGTRFVYSDINFEVLGELVGRVSGEPLDAYCAEHIFKPLGMKDTGFHPAPALRSRIAPTQYQEATTGKMLWGEVHDPTAYNMGGVAGHAGLFSTGDDLAIYAQMLLDGGAYRGTHILSPLSVEKMTTPQSPPGKTAVRGLGWDIDSPYASNRGELFPVGSYGHTGFTGTSIWIDPFSETYVILLTNRVHPDGKGDVVELRNKVATIAAAAVGKTLPAVASAQAGSRQAEIERRSTLTGAAEARRSYSPRALRNDKVEAGIDILEAENFASLAGLRIGLITNQTSLDHEGRRAIDVLARAPGVKLVALFSSEHGLAGDADTRVPSGREPVTGLPVYSLYGDVFRPTDKMLEGLDALVYDMADAGVRFYTRITTLGYTMEAAAKEGLGYFVLDRPDPIDGVSVEGPMLENDLRSFVGYFPLPVRYGMTPGEVARMFNEEGKLGVKLRVIPMRGWRREDWLDETGLPWVNPSPNLRNLTEETLYPGVCLVESANVSVGRGTDTPFELLGAPWINAKKLAANLNERRIQGVRFIPVDFTPRENRFQGQVCHGVQIVLLDREALDSSEMGVELLSALFHLSPKEFEIDKTLRLVGARWVVDAVKQGEDPQRIAYRWQAPLEQFRRLRAKYLMY